MFERRNIQRTYLKISREVKDFLLSDKSREFFIFLFFFFVAGGFWLLQTLNNDYEADFSTKHLFLIMWQSAMPDSLPIRMPV